MDRARGSGGSLVAPFRRQGIRLVRSSWCSARRRCKLRLCSASRSIESRQLSIWATSHPGWPQKRLIGNSPVNRGQKGIYRANKDFFLIFSVKCRGLKLRFLVFPRNPGGFKELREADRNHFHLSWYLLVPGVTSYGQKC